MDRMELREAMTQISEIRQTMAAARVCRGYRSAAVACSGFLALAGAAAQAVWLPAPQQAIGFYLALWIGVAVLAAGILTGSMFLSARRSGSALQLQINALVVEQFVPSLVAGVLLTYVVVHFAASSAWMLPGLWALLFSLGLYACCRLLPRPTFWAAGFYLLAGLVYLALGQGPWALSPWAMGLTFGGGQFLTAAILYWTLERGHGTSQQD